VGKFSQNDTKALRLLTDGRFKMRNGIARVQARIKILVILGAIGLAATASAGSVTGATITQLQIGTVYNEVFVSVNVSKTGNPSCSANGEFSFVLPLTTAIENQELALLLSARATGAPVTLTGSGLCDVYSSVETLVTVLY
jgi:hypothetical protein